MKKIVTILSILIIVFAQVLMANDNKRVYTTQKVNPHPPRIDGYENDVIWGKISAQGDFKQHQPKQGEDATEKTSFKITYDDDNMYVLINAYDNEPDKIRARLSRRDITDNSDVVGVMFDSYNDQQTAYEFSVNAAGVQADGVWSNNEEFDDRPNPIWDVKVSTNAQGWIAEMKIPLSQLRFVAKDVHTWGLQVYRWVDRKKEMDQWQYISPDTSGFVSNFGILQGIKDLRPPRRMEFLPYTLGKVKFDESESGNPYQRGHETFGTAGLDAKIGIGSNLTLDLTVNPDFGQVEADPSQVNLSAFESFFEEKRPFFIEGRSILSFGIGIGDGGLGSDNLFYSRRIGSSPFINSWEISDDPGDEPKILLENGEYFKRPTETTILTAAKITGRLNNGLSIGVLNAVTGNEYAEISNGSKSRNEIIQPLSNYALTKVKKDFRNGQTSVEAIVTAVNRDIPNENFYDLTRAAYTGGVHFWHEWKNRTYYVDAKFEGSHISGEQEAILAAQTASSRYFQRPGVDHVSVDSSATSMSGHGGSLMIGKQGNGKIRYVFASLWRSPGFEINDIGYTRQVDRVTNVFWMGYRENNKQRIFQRYSINLNYWNGYNFDKEFMYAGGNVNGYGLLTNYWGINGGINREFAGLAASVLRGGPMFKYEGAWNNWWGFHTDSRKKLKFRVNNFNHLNDDNISTVHNFRAGIEMQLNHRFNISVDPFYNNRYDDLQYVTSVEGNDGGDHYIFGRIDQKTWGTTIRFDMSLTPKLSIQFYGQPFISGGEYSNHKVITNPGADNYQDRYHEFIDSELSYDDEVYEVTYNDENYSFDDNNFNVREFNSNLVVRWEYKPGSTFFFVWNNGFFNYDGKRGRTNFSRDMNRLFASNPTSIFLVKFNYWLSI